MVYQWTRYLYQVQRGMFLRVWRQLLQFSPSCVMFCKMCLVVALCLISLSAFSEGFFMPASFRKQPDCVRRAPQTTFSNPHWIPTSVTGVGTNNGVNTIQTGYGNPKDFVAYQQQLPQALQQQQQQQQQQPIQQQTAYSSQLYNIQATGPKYETNTYQPVNQAQYAYEGIYPAPISSYSQSVQLVPCLCPVNKEIMEQQNQQPNPLAINPTSSSFPAETSSNAAAPPLQANQKKTT